MARETAQQANIDPMPFDKAESDAGAVEIEARRSRDPPVSSVGVWLILALAASLGLWALIFALIGRAVAFIQSG